MTVERAFREEWGRAVAVLTRVLGDLDRAEDAVQDAFTTALERWPRDGVPANPGAWIVTTARNRAIDRIRRDRNLERKTELLVLITPRLVTANETPTPVPTGEPSRDWRMDGFITKPIVPGGATQQQR